MTLILTEEQIYHIHMLVLNALGEAAYSPDLDAEGVESVLTDIAERTLEAAKRYEEDDLNS